MATIQEREAAYRSALKNTRIFDCNIWWDPRQSEGFKTYTELDALLDACEERGIDGGIVTARQSVVFDNYTGNENLRRLLDGRANFHGCMVLTPDVCFGGGGEGYIRELMAAGFAAARMFPKNFEHSMAPFAVEKVLDLLEDLGLPLMLWHDQVSWEDMDRICTAHPKLNVIVTAHTVKFLYYARQYLCLLQQHSNFYMESHNLVLPAELESISQFCGRMNVVFGSYFPCANPDFAAFRALNAEIPEEQRTAILSGNAEKLFPGCKGGRR